MIISYTPTNGNTYLPYPYPVNTCQLTIGNNTTTVLDTSNVNDGTTNYTCTSIRNDAFFDCTSLSNVTMPHVQSIGERAFNGCTSLTSATIPHVQSIGGSAFNGCTALSNATMPHVQSIGDTAFIGCSSLSNATMPHVQSIGDNAFFGCTSLTSVVIPESTTFIGFEAFANTRITTLYFFASPDITVGDNAFYNLELNDDDIITKIKISITYIYIKNICDKYKYAKLLSLPVELFYQYEENYNYCFLSRALLYVSCASMMTAYLVSKYMKKKKNRNTKGRSNLPVCIKN